MALERPPEAIRRLPLVILLAGIQLLTAYPGIGLLDPISGGLVMAAWTVLLCGAVWTMCCARDASG